MFFIEIRETHQLNICSNLLANWQETFDDAEDGDGEGGTIRDHLGAL